MIALGARDRARLAAILAPHLGGATLLAFGSRVRGGAGPWADLDLCVRGPAPLPWAQLETLREDLADSDLPFVVDLLDWHRLDPAIQAEIQACSVVLDLAGA